MLLAAGCAGPLSTLDPAGPAAERVATLWWVMLAGATLVTLGVTALALWPFRKRHEGGEVSTRLHLWGGGLVLPLTVLSALLLYAFALEWRAHGVFEDRLEEDRPTESLRVKAVARQWHWGFSYPDAPDGPRQSRGTLHIPAGRSVEVAITSHDVIHSFWVPRLAGKRDAIPGRINTLTIVADRPGSYGGVCSEFCGEGHAGMSFTVEAHALEDFDAAMRRLAREARP